MAAVFSEIPEGPVLRPSAKEFSNFRAFVNSLETRADLENCGVVKVS